MVRTIANSIDPELQKLRGMAEQEFSACIMQFRNVEHLLSELNETYGGEMISKYLMIALRKTRQKHNEDVDIYALKVQKLVNKIILAYELNPELP